VNAFNKENTGFRVKPGMTNIVEGNTGVYPVVDTGRE
jgi:hypothetical protein